MTAYLALISLLWTGVVLMGLLAYGVEREQWGLQYALLGVIAMAVLTGAWHWKKWGAIGTVALYGLGGTGWFLAGGGADAVAALAFAVAGAMVFAGRWRYFEPGPEPKVQNGPPDEPRTKPTVEAQSDPGDLAGRECPRCGQAVSANARFCERCGERLAAGP